MSTPDYLKDDKPDESDALAALKETVETYDELTAEIAELSEKLKEKNRNLQMVTQDRIPSILRQNGLSRIRLSDGREVSIKENINVSIQDQAAFVRWLEERNESDIVKLQLAFPRMSDEQRGKLYSLLLDNDFEDFDMKLDVHSQTRAKYFRDLLGINDEEQAQGVAEGKYLRKEDERLSFANFYVYWDTRIK